MGIDRSINQSHEAKNRPTERFAAQPRQTKKLRDKQKAGWRRNLGGSTLACNAGGLRGE